MVEEPVDVDLGHGALWQRDGGDSQPSTHRRSAVRFGMRRTAGSRHLASAGLMAVCFLVLFGGMRRGAAATTLVPPRPTGAPIVDDVGVLSAAGRQRLVALNERLARERGGAEIGVLVVATVGSDLPRTFATNVYNGWGLGRQASDNGAIIMVATDDHKVELVLGDGVDDAAGIATSRTIVSEYLVPAFKRGDFEAGILDGADRTATEILGLSDTAVPAVPAVPAVTAVTAVAAVTATSDSSTAITDSTSVAADAPVTIEPIANATHPGISRDALIQSIAVAAALSTGVVATFRYRHRHHPRPCPGCGKPMVRLDEDADDAKLDPPKRAEERVGSVDYDVWACGACDRALVLRYGKLFTHYKPCPQCGATTMSAASTTVQSPTTTSYGVARIDETCANCSYKSSHTNSIPRISTSSSSGSFGSSSSFSSNSSGGGGHSSGGGSSGSW